jgi:hypothetical protein
MSVRVETIQVKGIKEALAEVNSIDKRLRRSFTVEYKTIVAPLVSEAVTLVPVRPPMSGFTRNWMPRSYDTTHRRDNRLGEILPWSVGYSPAIKAFLSGKRPKTVGGTTRNLAAFGVKWTDRRSVFFDTSGQSKTPQGAQMIETLGRRYGPPSRVMWKAYEQSGPDIQYEIRQLVEKIMRAVGRDIKVV